MSDGWTIDIDAAGEPAEADEHFDDRMIEFERALEPWGGAVAASPQRDHFGARFSYDTDAINPVQVLEEGLDIFHDAAIAAGLPAWQVVQCEIREGPEMDSGGGEAVFVTDGGRPAT
jgi:hypothetical protein